LVVAAKLAMVKEFVGGLGTFGKRRRIDTQGNFRTATKRGLLL